MQSVKLLIESIVELALLLAYHSRPQEMGLMQVIQVFRETVALSLGASVPGS